MQPRQPLPAPFDRLPFTTRRALAAGLGRGRLSGSDLAQPLRGVNLARASPLTLQRRCAALQQRLPAHVYFSGITAASLTGVPLPSRHQLSRAVHVGVPAPHTAPTGRGVIGHQYQNPAWQLWHGLRVSTPARTWCELAASLTVGELVATGDFLIHWKLPLVSQRELRALVAQSSVRRGIRKLREAVELLHDRSESAQESALRLIMVRAGMPGLSVNLPIVTSGDFAYRADLAFALDRVVVEYQSGYHAAPEQFRADMTGRSRLEADGWTVIELNADDLLDPLELVGRIRQVLAARPG